MTSSRTRSLLLSVILCLAPAVVLILSPAAEAAKKEKPKPVAAKKKAAPSPSASKKTRTADTGVVASPPSAAGQAWEAPPKGDLTQMPPPQPPPPEPKPAPEPAPAAAPPAALPAAPPAAAPAAPAAAPPAETPAAPSQPESPPSAPPEEETMPALVPPPPAQYVEHLGPYPGRLRGLHGGSLWLEPSFHGLQFPYMTRTGVGVSGSVWVDSGYQQITSENSLVPKTASLLQQGRAVLRVTPTYVSGRLFVQAQVELVGNGCQTTDATVCPAAGTVDTDDLWLRIGQWNVWDLKVGRFEGWELYHTGMGLDLYTQERQGARQTVTTVTTGTTVTNLLPAPEYYGVTYLHDRPRGMGVGYAALHFFPLALLRFELLGELGTDDALNGGNNVWGGRPSAILDLGWLKLKAGGEYQSVTASTQMQTSSNGPWVDNKTETNKIGVGGAFQFVFDPYVEFGGNFGWGYVTQHGPDGTQDDTLSYATTSAGGFANARLGRRGSVLEDLLFGGGVNWTRQYYSHKLEGKDPDYTAHLQIFGALQYLVVKQLFVKAVIAYARADIRPSGQDYLSNAMWSARIRLMYLY